ncbi:MAG: hypothetical protein JWN84_3354 [Nocardioides sp.]|jgi:hypothetical protein|nr:hypothetical protein [Nocardioides sp.]
MQRRPRLLLAAGVVLLVLAGVMAWWQSSDPEPLPVSDVVISASTPVDQPVYVGVFTAGPDFGRTLHLSGVKVHATSNTDISLTPLLCRGGRFVQTTDPGVFCTVLTNPEGQELGPGDGIVLQVVSDEPAVAVVDRVELAFRENLRWATRPAGSETVVRVLPR